MDITKGKAEWLDNKFKKQEADSDFRKDIATLIG